MSEFAQGSRVSHGLCQALLLAGLATTPSACCDACNGCDGKTPSTDADASPGPEHYSGPWCGQHECPCRPGSEKRSERGKLDGCTLSEHAYIQGIPVVGDVTFGRTGLLRTFTLQHAHALNGVRCRAHGRVQRFANGTLRECESDATVVVDGFACTRTVALHVTGRLRRCMLVEPAQVGGISLPARAWIALYRSGALERFEAYGAPVQVGDLACRGAFNYLYESGGLRKCRLARPSRVDGDKLPTGAFVCFDEDGERIVCKEAEGRPR